MFSKFKEETKMNLTNLFSSNDQFLILKLNEVKRLKPHRVKQLATGDWKINPSKLIPVNHVIVLQQQEITGVFTLGPVFTVNRHTGRCSDLELLDIETEAAEALIGKKMDYKTFNPATIKSYKEIVSRIVDE